MPDTEKEGREIPLFLCTRGILSPLPLGRAVLASLGRPAQQELGIWTLKVG